jgi:hypothetical protein
VRLKQNLQKNTLAFNRGVKLRNAPFFLWWIEFHPILSPISFFMNAFSVVTYVFTTPTYTTTIKTPKPYALNVEFQHFIPKFNKISLLCKPHSKRG